MPIPTAVSLGNPVRRDSGYPVMEECLAARSVIAALMAKLDPFVSISSSDYPSGVIVMADEVTRPEATREIPALAMFNILTEDDRSHE